MGWNFKEGFGETKICATACSVRGVRIATIEAVTKILERCQKWNGVPNLSRKLAPYSLFSSSRGRSRGKDLS